MFHSNQSDCEFLPAGTSRRGLLERARHDSLGPAGGDRDLRGLTGDLARVARSRS